MELTAEQQAAVDGLIKFDKQIQVMSGYAGTGKTTVVSFLHEHLPDFHVCAFSGKAASILRKKGIDDATTIHSLIYKPLTGPDGKLMLGKDGSPIFMRNPELECAGIIVDESSMISKELFNDLCSYNLPIIFVGDGGQLEPIGEAINVMAKPDFVLQKIHRNAGEIAFFAQHIREGYRPSAYKFKGKAEKVHFISRYDAEQYYDKVDQIICAYNKTRVEVNKKVREQLKYPADTPVVGDKLICLRNNKIHGIYNGMQGHITKLFQKPKNKMVFSTELMDYEVMFDKNQFNLEKPDFSHDRNDPDPFDYAYCITAHKSQGDEFDTVMVLEQRCDKWDMVRWNYTAASRAKEHVIWVEGN